MSEQRKVGSVTYREVGEEYFQQRGLRRHAAFWSLWSLGVAAVISGDFYGWNLGLDAGGFGGLLVATIFIAAMYYGLCFSIAEMSPALPHTGGAYSFARSAGAIGIRTDFVSACWFGQLRAKVGGHPFGRFCRRWSSIGSPSRG